jgi:hypothetical protein
MTSIFRGWKAGAVCALWLLTAARLLADPPQPTETAANQNEVVSAPARKFIRVRRDDDNRPLAMETAIARFAPKGPADSGVIVDLVGAVHVGDKTYYNKLNEMFVTYDVVLYELVAPDDANVPGEGRKEGHPVGSVQRGLKSILELEFQLDCIDYKKDNFIHADMSPTEFARSMKDRGESFTQMFFRMMGQGIANQSKNPTQANDTQLLLAVFAKDRAMRMKRIVAQQFEELDGQMAALGGPEGSTIITERNKKAFEVMRRQLDKGHKRIAVFYGAGHLPDMEQRLIADFDMEYVETRWLSAWSLVGHKEQSQE